MIRGAVLVLLAVAQPAAAAAPPELAVRLSPESITVGDRVWASLEVTLDADAPPPVFPALEKSWGEAEVLGREPIVREGAGAGRVRYRQRVVLTAFRPGPLDLPAVTIGVPPGSLSTPPGLTLKVESVLPGESDSASPPSPRPPQPPRPLPVGATFWWSLGGGITLLAVALLLSALRPVRARSAAFSPPPAPPWPELLANLNQAGSAASPEAAHVALSLALRRYLGRSLGFPALESTSTEISRELAGRRAPHGAAARLRDLLAACDGVKFARVPADEAVVQARIAAARDAAGEIEGHLAPAPPPGAPLQGGGR
jgi:hypothetical protein